MYSGSFILSPRPAFSKPQGRRNQSLLPRAALDPWRVLGVAPNAKEGDIKAAHRKLVKQHHPDLKSDDPFAQANFIAIQEAYELLTGKGRGKEIDGHSKSSGWSFHDFYWTFKMRRRQGAGPHRSDPDILRHQWKSQLAGLRRKAASKRYSQPTSQTKGSVHHCQTVEKKKTQRHQESPRDSPLETAMAGIHAFQQQNNETVTKELKSHIVSFHEHSYASQESVSSDNEEPDTTAHAREFSMDKEHLAHQFAGLRRKASLKQEFCDAFK